MHKNYHYSGMSTPEAIDDFRSHYLSKLPAPLRWLVKIGLLRTSFTICCDGCGRKEIIDGNAELDNEGRWSGTMWTHQARLDFCEVCSQNGTAELSIAAGVQPLGSYTFGR